MRECKRPRQMLFVSKFGKTSVLYLLVILGQEKEELWTFVAFLALRFLAPQTGKNKSAS